MSHTKKSLGNLVIRYDKIAQRLFWHNIGADISKYIKSCEQCQKEGDLKTKILQLLRKNKNEIMVIDICRKRKLRWMTLCY